jgi:hypothetical protein
MSTRKFNFEETNSSDQLVSSAEPSVDEMAGRLFAIGRLFLLWISLVKFMRNTVSTIIKTKLLNKQKDQ